MFFLKYEAGFGNQFKQNGQLCGNPEFLETEKAVLYTLNRILALCPDWFNAARYGI